MPKIILPLLAAAMLCASCEKLMWGDEPDASPTATFDYLWNEVDAHYALFDVKGVDWQAVYDELRPRVWDGMEDDSLFAVLAEMLNRLDDGHVNLWNRYDASRSEEVFLRMHNRNNIDADVVALHYLGAHYHSAGGFLYNALRDGEVIYVRYASFSNSASASALQHIIARYPEAKGLILDVRQNGGGSIQNEWNILEVLPNHGQPLYVTQLKAGPAHEDFSPAVTHFAPDSNVADCPAFARPVAVLTDRGSYSATSFFALCMRAYDNVALLGDTTGGGLGLPNGGRLPNGWFYRFSVTRTLSPDGVNYENGVPPDEVVLLSPAATAQGKDNVIERAADWILGL